MLCEICHKNEAVIFLDQTQNQEHKHMHICMDCAKKNGIITDDFKISLFPQNFLKQFTTPKKIYPSTKSKKIRKFNLVQCPNCHTTLEDFKKAEQVGCASCWDIFAFNLVGKDYEDIHYEGKKNLFPHTQDKNNNIEFIEQNVKTLNIKLKKLIQKEQYEEAIQIREKIKMIKKQTNLCN